MKLTIVKLVAVFAVSVAFLIAQCDAVGAKNGEPAKSPSPASMGTELGGLLHEAPNKCKADGLEQVTALFQLFLNCFGLVLLAMMWIIFFLKVLRRVCPTWHQAGVEWVTWLMQLISTATKGLSDFKLAMSPRYLVLNLSAIDYHNRPKCHFFHGRQEMILELVSIHYPNGTKLHCSSDGPKLHSSHGQGVNIEQAFFHFGTGTHKLHFLHGGQEMVLELLSIDCDCSNGIKYHFLRP